MLIYKYIIYIYKYILYLNRVDFKSMSLTIGCGAVQNLVPASLALTNSPVSS